MRGRFLLANRQAHAIVHAHIEARAMTFALLSLFAFPRGFLCKSKPARLMLFAGGWALLLVASAVGLSLILAGVSNLQACNGSFPDVWGCPPEVQQSLTFRLSGGLIRYGVTGVVAFSFLYPLVLLLAGIIELMVRSDDTDREQM